MYIEKSSIKVMVTMLCIIGLCIILLFSISKSYSDYNKETHSNDVLITEWISPDGVHYWYQKDGYHSMLSPRYDADGQLVIDKKE